MLEKAIEKIKAEIEKSKNNSNIQIIGEFILRELALNNGASEKVLQEGKTIKGSVDEMKKVAKTRSVDGCGMLTDQEGFAIVLKYFDIKFTPITGLPISIEAVQAPITHIEQDKKPNIEFNVELDF